VQHSDASAVLATTAHSCHLLGNGTVRFTWARDIGSERLVLGKPVLSLSMLNSSRNLCFGEGGRAGIRTFRGGLRKPWEPVRAYVNLMVMLGNAREFGSPPGAPGILYVSRIASGGL